MKEAIFVAIEGADCSGKGTQTKYLAERLEAKTFKFPDKSTPIGKSIYDHLFQRWRIDGQPLLIEDGKLDVQHTEALMFQCMQMSNRLEHAQEIAETLHTLKKNVVSDRYSASGAVYGGYDGLDPHYINKIQDYLPKPDLNILLAIDAETAKERMKDRGDTPDRYERADIISRVVTLYSRHWSWMKLKEDEHQWVVINGNQPPIEVAADVVAAVKSYRATARLKEPVQW
jgi:dTMP kinase